MSGAAPQITPAGFMLSRLVMLASACGSSGGKGGGHRGIVQHDLSREHHRRGQWRLDIEHATSAHADFDDQWEARGKTQRDAIVKRIKGNKWGKSADGTKLTGPEGFAIDLSKCPADGAIPKA